MRTDDFDYVLPADRIAQTPVEPRDSARLLVLDRRTGDILHAVVRDLPSFLKPNDTMVINDTRVLPARLAARRDTGGKVELLLLRREADGVWEALTQPARRLGVGTTIQLERNPEVRVTVLETRRDGVRLVRISDEAAALGAGETPLPPYISAPRTDPERYQTVYAREIGSAAAPTAGLHFTNDLLARVAEVPVDIQRVTLHIGLDTFRPVNESDPTTHALHSEWRRVTAETAEALNATRQRGGRILAVGTTCVRTLESVVNADGVFRPAAGATSLYILPGFRFRAVDMLMTNFHLPKSTLVMLVSAFATREMILDTYRVAVEQGYRFYSFGDAMLIV